MPMLGTTEFAGEGEVVGGFCILVLRNEDVMLGIQWQLCSLPEELDPPLGEGSALLHFHPNQVTIWVASFFL